MLCTKSNGIGSSAAFAIVLAVFAFLGVDAAYAQEPPTTIPPGGPPPSTGAIPFNGWLLYPTLDLFSQYSNNYFLSPQSKISGWGFGESPSLTAEWSNGIHTTTLYGDFSHIDYPTQNEINTNDGQATFTQKYAPLRDLSFTFLADYTHKTVAPSLFSATPTAVAVPTTSVLPNGNTVLPNGLIVSPAGQVVGQSNPGLIVNGISVVNPYDQYTTSAQMDKIFADGSLSLNDTLRRTDFATITAQDFTSNATSESSSFWLGPVFYAYTTATFVTNQATNPTPSSQYYTVQGGLGTRQFGLFKASLYYGHQGSDSDGSPWAGGAEYGAKLSYYPTPIWTIAAAVDRTINIAPAQTVASNFAINIPVPTAVLVPLSSSAAITTTTLQSNYQLTPLWAISGVLGYTHVQDIGSPTWEDAWLTDLILKYDLRRNLTISLEYQYSNLITNVPFANANRNLVTMSALYKF